MDNQIMVMGNKIRFNSRNKKKKKAKKQESVAKWIVLTIIGEIMIFIMIGAGYPG